MDTPIILDLEGGGAIFIHVFSSCNLRNLFYQKTRKMMTESYK